MDGTELRYLDPYRFQLIDTRDVPELWRERHYDLIVRTSRYEAGNLTPAGRLRVASDGQGSTTSNHGE
jgi:hypothetical protein